MKPACGGILFCLVFCLVPAMAHAESADESEALRHYKLGLANVQRKAFGEAIAEFNLAYDVGHDFAVLYDIAQAYLAIDEPARALKMFKRYLAEGGNYVPDARRKEVEGEITKQQERVATVVIRTQFEGAVITVDGAEVGKTPLAEDLVLNVGVHVIAAAAPGHRSWEMRLELAGGDRRNLEVVLEADQPAEVVSSVAGGSAVAGQPAGQSGPPAVAAGRTRKVAAYIVGGAAIGALVVGSVFGVRAITKRRESDTECPAGQCSQAGVDLNNQAKTAARVADITIGVGLVGAGVATYLLLTAAKAAPQRPAVAARGMRLALDIGPGQAGIALGGAW
jgi:hypothetical protein